MARLTNQRMIGRHDWYREGADFLVHNQEELSGFWKGIGHGEDTPHVGTSLALLFLSKGRRPVLMAKLKHPPGDDWNHHRTDVANLTGYVERRWHRDLTWQVIDIRQATGDDLNQTPVVFISGRDVPELTDEQVTRLREYIDRGGFLIRRRLLRRRQLRCRVSQAHDAPSFPSPNIGCISCRQSTRCGMPKSRWIPTTCRRCWASTSVAAPAWCTARRTWAAIGSLARPDRETRFVGRVKAEIDAARSVGINVLAYATNRELKYKLEIPPLVEHDAAASQFDRAKLYVAKLRHQGGWNVAPAALPNLMKVVAQQTGLRISTDEQAISLADCAAVRFSAGLHARPQCVHIIAGGAQAAAHLHRSRRRAVCRRHVQQSGLRRQLSQGNEAGFSGSCAGTDCSLACTV